MTKSYPEGVFKEWVKERAADVKISNLHLSFDNQTLFFSMSTLPDIYGISRKGIYKVTKDDPNPVVIIPPPERGDYLLGDVSKDETKLLYTYKKLTFADPNTDIYISDIDGNNIVNITNNIDEEYSPSFSPDGKKILYYKINSKNSTYDLYTIDPDGSNEYELTNTSNLSENRPCYSPDGTKIVYDYGFGVNVINSDGSGSTKVLDKPNQDYWLNMHCWAPDPNYISPTPTPVPPSSTPVHCTPLGDLNCSGRVDIFDLTLLLGNFSSTSYTVGDLNNNGRVDIFDLTILLGNFGGSS